MSHLERREEFKVKERRPHCTVLTVRPMDCRWVTDFVTKSGFQIFCGEEALRSDRPYCKDHYGLVYIKGSSNRND
jgi:hypothetical protein